MKKQLSAAFLAVAAVVALGVAGQAPAQAQSKPKLYVGALSCNASGGGGFIFGSTNQLTCIFMSVSGKSAHYNGVVRDYGISIGQAKPTHSVWHVYMLGSDRGVGALAGDYVGSQETVALGLGGGGSIMIGGQDNEIVLQSARVDENAGFNFSEGLSKISLSR